MTDSLSEQFGQIYDQYIDKIYRFVYLKVGSREMAEDVTSKVFLKGWESYSAQGGPALGGQNSVIKNPGAFLYQIARNAVVDHYREKGRTKVVSADASPEIADPETSAHDMAVLSADINVIKQAINKLEKDHQDIIIWHYLEDMPIADIAELLNKPAGTVRVMLHRGLKELKGIIQEA